MTRLQQTVFYSWQSDSPSKSNRNFIQDALDKAVKALASKGNIAVDPVVDRDTRDVAGAPKIVDTILAKIDTAAAFVADVTLVAKTPGKTAQDRKALPNPNVMLELGYALKTLGDKRLILLTNTAFGRIEAAPFDLLGRRLTPYHLAKEHLGNDAESQIIRKKVKDKLAEDLERAILAILLLPPRDFNQLPAPLLILKGASALRNNAASLIGPSGGRVTIFKHGDRQGTSTRDGLTIAAQLTDQDHNTRQGIDLLSKAAYEAREQAGDGAKTAMLLCYEMVNGGYESVAKEQMLPDVISGMEYAVEKAIAYIHKQKRSLSRDGIPNVSKTAGDRTTAGLIAEAFAKAKPEGVLMVEEGDAPARSSVEIQEGVIFNRGYMADEFANDPATGNCVFDECFILVSEGTVSASREFISLLNKIANAQKPILVLAEDIDKMALDLLLLNNRKNTLPSVAVKAPGYNEEKRSWLRDIATITGGELFGSYSGRSFENADLSDLGTAERVVVEKDETQIIPGQANQDRIAIRLVQLRKQIERTDSSERYKLQNRLANLVGNTAVIKVGGRMRDELLDNKYKVTTAMHSVRHALTYGYVLGGGLTYYNAQKALGKELKLKSLNRGEKVGIKIIQRALEEPIRSLLTRGKQPIEDFRTHSERPDVGYNLVTKKYENFTEAGIWDSLVFTQYALQIAMSQAKMILETTSWDTIKPDLPFL